MVEHIDRAGNHLFYSSRVFFGC